MTRRASVAAATAVIAMQLAFLTGVIVVHGARVKSGTRVLLESAPYDPRAPFRGRYVRLHYKISFLPKKLYKGANSADLERGDPVYVTLRRRDNVWEADGLYPKKPLKGGVYLRGKVTHVTNDHVRVQYGFERFFLSGPAETVSGPALTPGEGARAERLGEEEKRLIRSGATRGWYHILRNEMAGWVAKGWLREGQAERIRTYYEAVYSGVNRARAAVVSETEPLFVEASVTGEGQGYALRLFWKGREYR